MPVRGAIGRGQLALRPAGASYLSDLPFDPQRMVAALHLAVDDALADGYAGFRVSGDMAWATRGIPGGDRLLDYESRVGEVFATRPAAAVCQYDLRRFDRTTITAAAGLHTSRLSATAAAASISVLPGGGGLRLAGEADLAVQDELRTVLSTVTSTELHLDLAGLRFIDVCCLTEIMTAARPPRRVVLHAPPPLAVRMLRLGWPDANAEVRP